MYTTWLVKIKHYVNNKSNVKKSIKRKEGKYKVVISLNLKGQEASIKNELYASESDTIKNGELKCILKYTLDIYSITVRKVSEKHQHKPAALTAEAVVVLHRQKHIWVNSSLLAK